MKDSELVIPHLTTGHNPQPFTFTSHWHISLQSILMLSWYLLHSLQTACISKGFLTKILHAFLGCPIAGSKCLMSLPTAIPYTFPGYPILTCPYFSITEANINVLTLSVFCKTKVK